MLRIVRQFHRYLLWQKGCDIRKRNLHLVIPARQNKGIYPCIIEQIRIILAKMPAGYERLHYLLIILAFHCYGNFGKTHTLCQHIALRQNRGK